MLLTVYLFSTNFNNQKTFHHEKKSALLISEQTAAEFYKKQCGFCHTSEELIGPDMKKIKAVYKEKYKNKTDFVNAIVKFVQNPNKKFSIYKEGIDNFSDMPKMPFKKEQVKKVAEYIFENNNL
jgi:cytochrome c551/c552